MIFIKKNIPRAQDVYTVHVSSPPYCHGHCRPLLAMLLLLLLLLFGGGGGKMDGGGRGDVAW